MDGGTIFRIERMEDLKDCFRSPMPSRAFMPVDVLVSGWPSFHASPADPDGGYREHAYTVVFNLDSERDCLLRLKIYVSTPRVPNLRVLVNGQAGDWFPWPRPAEDRVIRPAHALHASIYNSDEVELFIPGNLFRAGENRLTLTTVDAEPFVRVENREAVLRLDRMAGACGFYYAELSLQEAGAVRPAPSLQVRPRVTYIRAGDGLAERCSLVLTPPPGVPEAAGEVRFTWDGGAMTLPYRLGGRAFGQCQADFLLPDGEGPVRWKALGAVEAEGEFLRRRKWNVYTTPHAHTDIGYTHRQAEVMERMSRNLDTALKMLEGGQRESFSYILDSSWSLEDYLETRDGGAKERILREAAGGKIGIPANYVDLLNWFASLEELIHNGDFTERLLRPAGMKADRADIVDVASASWSLPSLLNGMGVHYLLHADNQDRGPFRLNGGLHRKSPFYWQGPDGARVLTWLARMYCELKKVCGSPGSIPAARRGLDMWLMAYEREDYQPDAVILYGQEADNTDLDVRMAAFQGEWNGEVAYPRLIPSDVSSFFRYVERWADSFPVYKGDEGAYWEDGASASVKESFMARKAQAVLKLAETLESLAVLAGGTGRFPSAQYAQAWRWLLLYDEHTWGSFMTGSDPDSLLQQSQWRVKANMARQAAILADNLLTRAASRLSLLWNNQGRELVVYNPYGFPLGGLVETEFSPVETLCGEQGVELPWQEGDRTGTLVRARALVPEIPPFSYRRFPLRPKREGDRGGAFERRPAGGLVSIENGCYRAVVCTQRAAVVSLLDKAQGRELSGSELGALLYARGGEGTTLLGNHPEYRQEAPETLRGFAVRTAFVERSFVGEAVVLEGEAAFGKVCARFSLPSGLRRLDLEYRICKLETARPEALYVDFPLNLNRDADVLSDGQTGWVDWSRDVLPGACREWMPLQTSVLVRDGEQDVQIASPDAFLFTVGGPVAGRWTSELETLGNRILSYVLNNYWRTNYPVLQGGDIRFAYSLTSAGHIPFEEAFRFGWSARQGLVAQRMSYQEFRTGVPPVFADPSGSTLMKGLPDHIHLNTLRGSDWEPGAFLARLLECGGRAGTAALSLPGLRAWRQVDHLERPLGERIPVQDATVELNFSPWQVRSVLLYFTPPASP